MHLFGIGAASGVNPSLAREWKGMAFSACKGLCNPRPHAHVVWSNRHEQHIIPSEAAEEASEWPLTEQWAGEPVIRSVEERRLKGL